MPNNNISEALPKTADIPNSDGEFTCTSAIVKPGVLQSTQASPRTEAGFSTSSITEVQFLLIILYANMN